MKTLKTSVLAILFATFGLAATAQSGYGEIRGVIRDADTKEPVPFATVKILQGNVLVGGTQTDMEGNYKYKPLNPGKYEMMVIEAGHKTQPVNKINVIPNEATYVDVKVQPNTLATVEVVAPAIVYAPGGVDKTMYTFNSLDAKELKQLAGANPGDVKGTLELMTSNVVVTGNGEVHVRGGRDGQTSYFIDGVRCLGPNTIPSMAIENLTFFSGGVPAMYGDMMSGAVIVTTKSYFSGLREKNIRNQEYRERQEARRAAAKAKEEEERSRKAQEEAEKDTKEE